MTINFDIQSAKKKAEAEITEERIAEATKQIKSKMKAIAAAKVVVANLERELEALEHELQAGV